MLLELKQHGQFLRIPERSISPETAAKVMRADKYAELAERWRKVQARRSLGLTSRCDVVRRSLAEGAARQVRPARSAGERPSSACSAMTSPVLPPAVTESDDGDELGESQGRR